MSLWAIVPVKPFRRGKSRLSGVLSEDERVVLSATMLSSTLKLIQSIQEIRNTLVVSRDESAFRMTKNLGLMAIQEPEDADLNSALDFALLKTADRSIDSILIFPADLPLLTREDILEILALRGSSPEMIIAPDRREDGTNALYLSPPGVIKFSFGQGSFNLHLQQAKLKGIQARIIRSLTLGLDLDLPEDLDLFKQMEECGLGEKNLSH